MRYSLDDLSRHFGATTFARGDSYARDGKVLTLQAGPQRLDSEVGGSGNAIYRQTIRFKSIDGAIGFDGKCSCPVSRNCKHVVAALVFSLRQDEAALASGVPPATDQWLAQLVEAGTPPAVTARFRRKLVFVLVPDPVDGAPRLRVGEARLKKDGTILGASSDLHPEFLLVDDGLYDLSQQEEDSLRLMAALQPQRDKGTAWNEGTRMHGSLGHQLLAALCADGDLLWADSRAELTRGIQRQVRWGPVRHASLGWHADQNAPELFRLGFRFDDDEENGAPAQVLATRPPLYVDDGQLGEVVLRGLGEGVSLAQLLPVIAQAPPLLPSQRAGMSRRLLDAGLEHLVPLPQPVVTHRRQLAPTPRLLLASAAIPPPPPRWGMHGRRLPEPQPGWCDFAVLFFDYDGMRVLPLDDAPLRRVTADGAIELIDRDIQLEEAACNTVERLGFAVNEVEVDAIAGAAALAGAPLHGAPMQLPTDAAWLRFARQQLPALHAAGWQVELHDSFRYNLAEPDDWYADLDAGNGEAAATDWFALELGIVVGGQRHALLPLLLQALRAAPGHWSFHDYSEQIDGDDIVVTLPDASRVVLPWERVRPLLATLRELHFRDDNGAGWRLPFTSAARLAELEQAAQLRWHGNERLLAIGRKLQQFESITPVALPVGLQAQLRPYQHAGLSWMQFLREYGFNGILADDMGLGKTVQTLAHILAEKEAGRLDRPALVVAPTSLMGNWQSEAARFTPGLRVLLLHGKERLGQFDQIAQADLVLTTYALLSRDEAALRRHRYHLLILDEAQYIKNSRARAAQTARLLEARHRLCLTGTPVQNHLGELWSQFHFLMPGLLGELSAFNSTVRKPIEMQGNSARQAWLNQRIKPFMLRRTKDKVATELPPKTDIILPVAFDSAQRDLYETVRVAMDRKVREEIDRRGLARSHIVILDALLKLRQVCCDPRLLKKPVSTAGSAKLETMLELLATLRSEGRKVLIFSQFTSMLALIGDALRSRAIDYALLTGATVHRAAPIAAFQGGLVDVFLISLKAGGVGLNLTAADTVIHYDPWWNPAAEQQATDRAWRIGQTQPVFVYKLIAQGTLEEKIQEMQKRKGALASAVFDAEGQLAGNLGAADLQAILAP